MGMSERPIARTEWVYDERDALPPVLLNAGKIGDVRQGIEMLRNCKYTVEYRSSAL